jgi:hypothetical protein
MVNMVVHPLSKRARTASSPSSPSGMNTILRYFSPAERVPVELLRRIMQMCMEDLTGNLDSTQPPLAFLHVCPTWAAIAESTPDLWSSIEVTHLQFLPSNVEAVKQWLQRTRSVQLRVVIVAPIIVDPTLLYAMLSTFIPTSARWQHLNLAIHAAALPLLLNNPHAPLTSLESLTLALTAQPYLDLSPTATRLRSVILKIHPPMKAPHGGLMNLGWGQLKHLEMSTVAGTIDIIWNIVTRCHDLESLTITAPNGYAIPYIPFYSQNLFYSKLRQLILVICARPGVIGYLLDGLHLPYLQDLQIHFTNRVYDTHIWPKSEILSLRSRSLPPLSMVSVMGKTIEEDDLCDFVTRMKYLEKLAVNDGSADLVTTAVSGLLPRTAADIQRQRDAHRKERILNDVV